MPTFSYGFSPGETSSGTVNLPKRAVDVTVTVAGARGGQGGSDAGGPGGSGGSGRGGALRLPFATFAYSVSVYCGSSGSNGASGPPGGKARAPGGGGGTSSLDGGKGGRDSLGGGWSGCGGGGGGGTYAVYTTDTVSTVLAAAGGGGGGGGGSWNRSGQNGPTPYDWSGWDPATGNMSTAFSAGKNGSNCPYDGGGGGGGGGGVGSDNGDGGSYGTDNNVGGRRGESGGSFIAIGLVDEIESSFVNTGNGYAIVEYVTPDWIPDAFSIANVTGANPNSNVIIATNIPITGINVPITVFSNTSGIQVRKNGTTNWVTTIPVIENNESFDVRFKTPNTGGEGDLGFSVSSACDVCAGLSDEPDDWVCASFSVTTRAPDITPNQFDWAPSDENTPFANENIQSNAITINGFEIPLAITANHPIQVQINNDGVWRDIQQT